MFRILARKFSNAQESVNSLVNSNPVMVFSKSYCPFCDAAKSKLKGLKVPFNALELDQDSSGREYQRVLTEMTKQRTVPYVFVAQKFIGGCDELMDGIKEGKIQKIFQEANIEHSDK